ncbi:MAG TPA: sulfite exporter TauE/SafE family protein, partial [Aliiroseovarius sp.]|nr:sulfite exporter TauE/SafE family protein [Aliiroseovarius sp.]
GGFLLVPYMATILTMPMYIIPATAAIAIFMSLAVSITNFLVLGAPLEIRLLLPLIIGAVLGAVAGPVLNKRMKNSWLQAALAIVVTLIGLKYLLT